ncbi:MAG: hypothetical protein R3B72_36160 [Polyangiaceae bacterium]
MAPLAREVAAGDVERFPSLVEQLWDPSLRLVAASRAMRGLRAGEDEIRDVATRLMERLSRDEHRALRLYVPWQDANPDKTFADWFKIVVANVVRDFAREQRGSERRRLPAGDSGEPSVKRLLNQFASTLPLDILGTRPAMTDAQTARELLLFAERHLPAEQLAALTRWIAGSSFEDIAASQALESAEAARKQVRRAVATLRRKFGKPAE